MPMTAEQYFQREVIRTGRAAQQAIRNITDMPASLVKKEMHKANDKIHKSKFPITHMHIKKSINGGGQLKHTETSKVAAAILASAEVRKMAQRNANSCFKTRVLFKSNRDLARAFYTATIMGEVAQDGKKLVLTGKLIDIYDFRFDLWPKDFSIPGAKLRLAGNAAYIAQEMGLLKPVKLTVDLAGPVK